MGERDAQFRDFVADSQGRLVRFAELLVDDRGRAEDLVQEAYVAAPSTRRRVRPCSNVARQRTADALVAGRQRDTHAHGQQHTRTNPDADTGQPRSDADGVARGHRFAAGRNDALATSQSRPVEVDLPRGVFVRPSVR